MVIPPQHKYSYPPRFNKVQLPIMIEYVLRGFENEILPRLDILYQVLDTRLTGILPVTSSFTEPY